MTSSANPPPAAEFIPSTEAVFEAGFAAYSQRMTAMCDAAVDAGRFGEMQSKFQHAGFLIHRAEALHDSPGDVPLGWVLTGSIVSKT